MRKTRVNINDVRRLAVRCQLLDDASVLRSDSRGTLHNIEQMGYIQLDTIQVIERAHHHTLWNRQPGYQSGMLDGSLAEIGVFEYWAHAFSYIPLSDYRFYLPRMHSYHDPIGKWEKNRREKYGHLMQPVLERIRAEGPQTASDMKSLAVEEANGSVWMMHPSKAALEYLLLRGDLMVKERRRFQRVYDLTERILPPDVDTRMPTDEELGRFFVRRALLAHGVMSETDIKQHIDAAGKEIISSALKEMVSSGDVIQAEVEGMRKSIFYVLPELLDDSSQAAAENDRVAILSPFDNLLFSRRRILRFFGFDYRLECYIPERKRQFGYFALPLLWKGRIVGQLDAKAYRKEKILAVQKLAFNENFKDIDEVLPKLAATLLQFCRFNRCEHVRIDETIPVNAAQPLQKLVLNEGEG